MKNLIIILLVCITTMVNAQKLKEADVPTAVKNSFMKAHPHVKDAKWNKEGDKFEAGFEMNKMECALVFDAKGNITETENQISLSQLPKEITDYVNKHYKNQKIKEAAKITDADGKISFEAEVNGKDLIFNEKGEFLKESKD